VTFKENGFTVTSFARDDWRECRRHVAEVLAGKIVERPELPRDDKNIERARVIWREAVDVRWTLGAIYLARRCLSFDADRDWHGVIRFHPACPFGKDRAPAMIALMRDVITNEARCIQRTRLTRDGHKVERLMLGPAKGAAIKIDEDSCITTGLSISEGLETALSGRAMGIRPAWALGSAGGIAHFPVLNGIERLNFLGERDENATNEASVLECADRWCRAGREVRVFWPEVGKDLNDEWQAKNAVDSSSWLAVVEGLWPGATPMAEEEAKFREELRDLREFNAWAYRRSCRAY